jgi:hypothetical protein
MVAPAAIGGRRRGHSNRPSFLPPQLGDTPAHPIELLPFTKAEVVVDGRPADGRNEVFEIG